MNNQYGVVLIPGHGEKSDGAWDPGAVNGPFQEADSVRVISGKLRQHLEASGIRVSYQPRGSYRDRTNAGCAALKACHRIAVIHLHHNASASKLARHYMSMYDARSGNGKTLAADLSRSVCGSSFPWAKKQEHTKAVDFNVKDVPVHDDSGTEGGWLYRAFRCIQSAWGQPANVSACLLEMGFISNADTASWLQSAANQDLLARSITGGLAEYFQRFEP